MPALRNKSWPGPNRGTALKGGAALSSSTLGCIRFTLLSPQSTSVAVRPLGLAPCYLAYYLAGPCSPGSTMLARRCGCGSMFAVSPCSLVAGTYSYRRTPRPRAPRRCVAWTITLRAGAARAQPSRDQSRTAGEISAHIAHRCILDSR